MIRSLALVVPLAACAATAPEPDAMAARADLCFADAQGARFETPCAVQRGEVDFIMQVQRALQARNLYAGEIHGRYDTATQMAVAAYQAETGPESGILSTASAKRLGLVALGREAVLADQGRG